MPQGSEVKTLRENKDKLYYADFIDKNNDVVCATVEIPPDVAMSKYNENYSASRAAIKDWENTLNIKRTDFGRQFLQNVYNFWLDIEILNNRIQAPGYLIARQVTNDYMVLNAYRTCRWTGAPVPHIDPFKEVQAEREKLGVTAAAIPLTTIERATEILNGGDSDHNMEQYAQELERSKQLGIELPEETTETVNVSE
jgi:capsid protein